MGFHKTIAQVEPIVSIRTPVKGVIHVGPPRIWSDTRFNPHPREGGDKTFDLHP